MAGKLMRIRGMTCDHCEKTVAEALTDAGALHVSVDWRAGRAQFDAASSREEQLSAAVEGAGYHVVSFEALKRTASGVIPVAGDKSGEYDLVVLGSGSAAFAAAITAT